jgi:DNA segregation ATPase FtsK/SpoIIIE-like protein
LNTILPVQPRVSQRQRVAVYESFVAGVALDLAAETLAIVPELSEVTIRGVQVVPDPATGQDVASVALSLFVSRERLARIRLERVDPPVALRGLGGLFDVTPRGYLTAINGMTPILDVTLDEIEFTYRDYVLGETGPPLDDEIRDAERDPLFRDAAKVCIQQQGGSTSVLQRCLSIGYGRAARIIDQLHAGGVLGPPNGTNPRNVLVGFDELARICGQ